MNIGFAGEFKCVVKDKNGNFKQVLDWQKNLILNNLFDFFGTTSNNKAMTYCVIGSGNSIPSATQTQLDSYITKNTSGTEISRTSDYDPERDGNFYKCSVTKKFTFESIGAFNISELGLCWGFTTNSNYNLGTRALIKNALGETTTISLLADETLEVFYRLYQVWDVRDTVGVINQTDGEGVITQYNYTSRLAMAGISHEFNSGYFLGQVFSITRNPYTVLPPRISSNDIGTIVSSPSSYIHQASNNWQPIYGDYITGSYKRTVKWELGLTEANGNIRSVTLGSSMGMWQFRYGSVDNDSPIVKNNTQKLTLVFEFSWGRYEGEL